MNCLIRGNFFFTKVVQKIALHENCTKNLVPQNLIRGRFGLALFDEKGYGSKRLIALFLGQHKILIRYQFSLSHSDNRPKL